MRIDEVEIVRHKEGEGSSSDICWSPGGGDTERGCLYTLEVPYAYTFRRIRRAAARVGAWRVPSVKASLFLARKRPQLLPGPKMTYGPFSNNSQGERHGARSAIPPDRRPRSPSG